MWLRLISPLRVDFATVPGAVARDPEGFSGLCARGVRAESGCRVLVHAEPSTSGPAARYGSVRRSEIAVPALLEWRAESMVLPEVEVASDDSTRRSARYLDVKLVEVELRVFDHWTAIVECNVQVPPDALDGARAESSGREADRASNVESFAHAVGVRLGAQVCEEWMAPTMGRLRRDAQAGRFFAPSRSCDPHWRPGAAWVARALFVDDVDKHADLLRQWLFDVDSSDRREAAVDDLLSGRRDRHVQWLNYVFVERGATGPGEASAWRAKFADVWEGLRLAQYFYAAADRVDDDLHDVLMRSLSQPKDVDSLGARLESLTDRCGVIRLELANARKYLRRPVVAELDRMLGVWSFADLVLDPLGLKAALSRERLDQLESRRSRQAAIFTDFILLGIGVVSVVGTSLTIADYGRSAMTDASVSAYEAGGAGPLAWFAAQPVEVIMSVTTCVSLRALPPDLGHGVCYAAVGSVAARRAS